MGRRPGAAAESSGEGCSCSGRQQGQKESCLNVSHKAFPSARRSEYCGDVYLLCQSSTSPLTSRTDLIRKSFLCIVELKRGSQTILSKIKFFGGFFFFFNLAPPINKRLLYDLVHFIFTKSPKYLKDKL